MTRGERNNNPGNIRKSDIVWKGEEQGDDKAFEVFDTPEDGIRALAKLLNHYYYKDNIKTVAGIITKYAPANENDTKAYTVAVCADMGVMADQILNFNRSTLVSLVRAIIHHENGRVIYTDKQITDGVTAAYS